MAEREAVGPLRCADADAAAATLLRAFFEDPFLVWLFPDAARRPRAGLWFLRTCVEYGLRYGAASSNEDASGVALWLTPGNTTTTLTRLARAGFLQMPFRVGLTAFSRFAAAGSVLEPAHKAHVPGPHWYLFWLGVEPSRRCAGI
ncbi:MAG: hypothetical protein FJ313_04440, partial [Gemmatimonadetes bacterium]|nr:hypothetical protein [Gemmatimonadota bacterium]